METNETIELFRSKVKTLIARGGNDLAPGLGEKPEAAGHHYHQAFQAAAFRVLKKIIEPRIDIIVESVGTASIEVQADLRYARLSVSEAGSEMPAYLFFCLLEGRQGTTLEIYAESCLGPLSGECQPARSFSLFLDDPDYVRTERFVENVVLGFFGKYIELTNRT